jgi:hypothetical protein
VTAARIILEIEAAGGVLALNGDRIHYDVPKAIRALLDAVRVHRGEVLQVLRLRQETAKQHVSRWMEMRCTQSHLAWGAEKFLYQDFAAWCQQHNAAPNSRGLFCAILNESFDRDENGWRGLCLAVDFSVPSAGALTQNTGRTV